MLKSLGYRVGEAFNYPYIYNTLVSVSDNRYRFTPDYQKDKSRYLSNPPTNNILVDLTNKNSKDINDFMVYNGFNLNWYK